MSRIVRFAALFAAGLLVYFVGGYWTGLAGSARTAVKLVIPLLLLAATIGAGRVRLLQPWRKVSLALLAASVGFLAAWLLSDHLLGLFGVEAASVAGIALSKLSESVLIVLPALLVARLGGATRQELYLQRGKLRGWLITGLATFGGFGVLFLLQAFGQGIGTARLLALAPWTLLFVLSNAFMEELHFRGLLLRPFQEHLGRHGANLCIALFFTLIHAPVTYTPDILPFLAILFVLALAWGYVIQRTEALWGSVLFHAGADLMIVLGIYQTFGAG